jgi:predicted phosphate transport protein (TIGR00153 family)
LKDVKQLSWFDLFRKEPTNKTMFLAQKEITKAISTVTELREIMLSFAKGKISEVEELINELFLHETEIDDIRRSVLSELTEQDLPSQYRQNLIHIVKCLDILADHVKDSARNVKVLINTKLPKEILEINIKIVETLVEGARFLSTAIEMLGINHPQALEFSKKVDEKESIVDEYYLKEKALFLKYERELGIAKLLVLKDLLECLERIADTLADTADYIRVLTVKK